MGVAFITALIRFVPTSLVYENRNNGDKFYHRKSMQAADEKLNQRIGPFFILVTSTSCRLEVASFPGEPGNEARLEV